MNWRGVMAWSALPRRAAAAPPSACSIVDGRPVDTVRRELADVRSVQFNFRYFPRKQKPAIEGTPRNTPSPSFRCAGACARRGMNVTIAVIDSGIDVKHPELANSVADGFDALGSKRRPHVHGTGIAGAIVAHAKLMGSAPEARLLAIRASARDRRARRARPM
jgi:subtilisin family serine protease